MLLQANDLGRLLIIYISQTSLSIIFLYIAYKILRRNRNRLTIILSGFYISVASAFIINAILVPLRVNPIVFILYFITIFLILFGQIFLVMFNLFLNKLETKIPIRHLMFYISIYAILIFSILLFPNGITLNEETDWRPVWSWSFLIIMIIFSACFIVIPFISLFIKAYRRFEDKSLKKKMRYFFIGFCGVIFSYFGGMFYVTWNDPLFRTIWYLVVLFILIPSCILIYYGIGSGL